MPYFTPSYFSPYYWPPGWSAPVSRVPAANTQTDLLQWGLAALTVEMTTHASQPIIYARGALSVDTRATFGSKLLKLDDGQGGIRMEWTDMDFLIPAEGFAFDGTPIEPTRGDTVYLLVGDNVQTFEVMPFGGEAPWRWADPHQSMIRVHTKHIGSEPYDL